MARGVRVCVNAVQALCEVFDRPAEIYVYDAARGAKKLRTFHSARSSGRPPVRLSYYGGGHYDSIVGPGFDSSLLRSPPGEVEMTFLRRVRERRLPSVVEVGTQHRFTVTMSGVIAAFGCYCYVCLSSLIKSNFFFFYTIQSIF